MFFYFFPKPLFVTAIFTFLFRLFGYLEKLLDKKVTANSKIYDVVDWTANNHNTHIAQYFKK